MRSKFFIYVSKKIGRSILKVPKNIRRKVYATIDLLEDDPYIGSPMGGDMKGSYKIRVWPYRIIYKLHKRKKTIEIIEVSHRGSVSYD